MTIGIVASGPGAGAAVMAALDAAEVLGSGAIGGFAVFAMLDGEGRVHRTAVQRGGSLSLDVPATWRAATRAAVISSGPDRPEPLSQFLPALDGVGLVTGHRLPHLPGADGVPVNRAVLERIRAGAVPQEAVDEVLSALPELDAGLIALSADGQVGWANTQRVRRRPDHGHAWRARPAEAGSEALQLALLHNAIHARVPLAAAVADIAWEVLTGQPQPTRALRLEPSVPIQAAEADGVTIAADGRIVRIDTADTRLTQGRHRTGAVYLGSPVWLDGVCIGHTVTELSADLVDGTVRALGGPRDLIFMQANDDVAS